MTDTLIHNSSNHPIQHKYAAFRSMIHRLLKTPMSLEDYKEEINTIKYMAHTNGYKHTLIDKLLKQMKKDKNQQHTKTDNKYITLTFINKHSEKLAHKFRKYVHKVAFRIKNKTMKYFTHRIHQTHIHKLLVYTDQTAQSAINSTLAKRLAVSHKDSKNTQK